MKKPWGWYSYHYLVGAIVNHHAWDTVTINDRKIFFFYCIQNIVSAYLSKNIAVILVVVSAYPECLGHANVICDFHWLLDGLCQIRITQGGFCPDTSKCSVVPSVSVCSPSKSSKMYLAYPGLKWRGISKKDVMLSSTLKRPERSMLAVRQWLCWQYIKEAWKKNASSKTVVMLAADPVPSCGQCDGCELQPNSACSTQHDGPAGQTWGTTCHCCTAK